MVSTVTTSTVTTIATMAGLSVSLGLMAVLALIAFLTTKELTSATESLRLRLTARFSDVGIIALLLVFVFIVTMKVWEILAK